MKHDGCPQGRNFLAIVHWMSVPRVRAALGQKSNLSESFLPAAATLTLFWNLLYLRQKVDLLDLVIVHHDNIDASPILLRVFIRAQDHSCPRRTSCMRGGKGGGRGIRR
jgi:hypothetical protein